MKNYWLNHQTEVVSIIAATSVVALIYNVVHAALIHKISAVSVTVLGEVKIVAILLLSTLILGEIPEAFVQFEMYSGYIWPALTWLMRQPVCCVQARIAFSH